MIALKGDIAVLTSSDFTGHRRDGKCPIPCTGHSFDHDITTSM